MGRNNYLSIEEVKLFTPFRYDYDSDGVVWMLIGAPSSRAGNHYIGLTINRGYIYCETMPEIQNLVEPVRDVPVKKFIKALLSKCEWNEEQIVAFKIGIGNDGRDQGNLKDFS